jgi:hypothetical protein
LKHQITRQKALPVKKSEGSSWVSISIMNKEASCWWNGKTRTRDHRQQVEGPCLIFQIKIVSWLATWNFVFKGHPLFFLLFMALLPNTGLHSRKTIVTFVNLQFNTTVFLISLLNLLFVRGTKCFSSYFFFLLQKYL